MRIFLRKIRTSRIFKKRNNMCSMKLTDQAKNALLNTINDQGFVLEHRLHSLLKRHFPANQPRRGEVVFFKDVRREFDATLEIGLANFIFECKRSVFDFFFLASGDYPRSCSGKRSKTRQTLYFYPKSVKR